MRRIGYKFALFLFGIAGFVNFAAAATNEEVERFVCKAPNNISEKEFYDEIIVGTGRSVLVSRGDTWFSDVELCMFGWYVSDKFSLAGYTWITHHALLRMMSSDPEQFFKVIKENKPAGYSVWRDSLEHSQLWLYGDECPKPNPLQQAVRSIEGYSFRDQELERVRVDVLQRLKGLTCQVPD